MGARRMGESARQAGAFALPESVERAVREWIHGMAERQALHPAEIRKGVRALSARYVEGRTSGGVGAGALGGAGLRAAFATFYAPLHFLTAYAAASTLPAPLRTAPRRVVDLGAGTGATGAALALACGHATLRTPTVHAPTVLALDRSAWALGEARRTFAAFGLRGRTRRVELPSGVPRLGAGDLVAAGWLLNECRPETRARITGILSRALRAGARVLVLEPLARTAAPWWDDFASELAPLGAAAELIRFAIERPAWIERLDAASGLDHREIGARVLWGPLERPAPTSHVDRSPAGSTISSGGDEPCNTC